MGMIVLETVYTFWFIGILIGIPALIVLASMLIAIIKRPVIKEMDEHVEDIHIKNEILNQLIESDQNCFM